MAHREYLLTSIGGKRRHIGRLERDELLSQSKIKLEHGKHYVEEGYEPPISKVEVPDDFTRWAIPSSIVNIGPGNIGGGRNGTSWFDRQIRESRENNAPGVHTEEQWIERVKYFGWRCRYCKDLLTLKTLTKDHQIPLSRRGSQWASNLVPACQFCNCSKNNRKPSEWRVIVT